jgi:phage tail tape-measure protein
LMKTPRGGRMMARMMSIMVAVLSDIGCRGAGGSAIVRVSTLELRCERRGSIDRSPARPSRSSNDCVDAGGRCGDGCANGE